MWTQLLKLCWLNTLERFFCALCSISPFCFFLFISFLFFSFLFCSFLFFFLLPFVSSNEIECSLFDESFISTRSSLSCLSAEKKNFCFFFFLLLLFLIKNKLICLRNNIQVSLLSSSFIHWFLVNSTRLRAFFL